MHKFKRFAVLMLTLCLLVSWIPVPARAVCEHHPEHTEDCGFLPDVEEAVCSYSCEICAAVMEVPPPEESVLYEITVCVSGQEPFSLEVLSTDTADRLFQAISDKSIALSSPVAALEGTVLESGHTLDSYGVGRGSTITVQNRYSVTIVPSENGTVSSSACIYPEQDMVYLTVSPAPGYALESLTAGSVALTESDGFYSFTMPAEHVSVSAVFGSCNHETGSVSYTANTQEHYKIFTCCGLQETESHSFSPENHKCVCGETEQFTISVRNGENVSQQDYPYGSQISLDECYRDGYNHIGYAEGSLETPATTYDSNTGKFLYTVSGNAELHPVFMEICRCSLTLSADALSAGRVLQSYSHSFQSDFTSDENFGQTPVIIYSVSDGSLPAGIALDPTTGVLSGTPSEAGTFSFTVTAIANEGGYHQATAVQEYTLVIEKWPVTVQAKDQTITWGTYISQDDYLVEGLLPGDKAQVLLTPSTANVTASGSVAPSAVITSSYGSPDEIYTVSYIPGKLVINPDTSKIDDLTKENVTSANEADIRAVQAMMDSAELQGADEETRKKWNAITEKCEALLAAISGTSERMRTLTEQAATFNPDTVTSEQKTTLQQTAADMQTLLSGNNLTAEEKAQLQPALIRIQSMLETLDAVAADMDSAIQTIEDIDPETVTSSEASSISGAVEAIDTLLAGDHLTAQERTDLEGKRATAISLINLIHAAAAALKTENLKMASTITAETVKASDKSLLQNAKADLQQAMERYGSHYTTAQWQQIIETSARMDGALEAIGHAEAVTASIAALPDSVEPDDEDTAEKILAAQTALNDLTDNEKSMVPDSALQKLKNLQEDLKDYEVIKGNHSKWTRGSSTTLVFTVNGPVSKFAGIQIDGKRVSSVYYTVKSGSTIVTLSHFYIRSLSYGKHTIDFLYTDGEISAVFHTQPRTASPATGDDSSIHLWMTVLVGSSTLLAAMFVLNKRMNNSIS